MSSRSAEHCSFDKSWVQTNGQGAATWAGTLLRAQSVFEGVLAVTTNDAYCGMAGPWRSRSRSHSHRIDSRYSPRRPRREWIQGTLPALLVYRPAGHRLTVVHDTTTNVKRRHVAACSLGVVLVLRDNVCDGSGRQDTWAPHHEWPWRKTSRRDRIGSGSSAVNWSCLDWTRQPSESDRQNSPAAAERLPRRAHQRTGSPSFSTHFRGDRPSEPIESEQKSRWVFSFQFVQVQTRVTDTRAAVKAAAVAFRRFGDPAPCLRRCWGRFLIALCGCNLQIVGCVW